MKYQPNTLDFEMRAEALRLAIQYLSQYGGDVLARADEFYCFLANKPQPKKQAAKKPIKNVNVTINGGGSAAGIAHAIATGNANSNKIQTSYTNRRP